VLGFADVASRYVRVESLGQKGALIFLFLLFDGTPGEGSRCGGDSRARGRCGTKFSIDRRAKVGSCRE
jgi:hypothetical protein